MKGLDGRVAVVTGGCERRGAGDCGGARCRRRAGRRRGRRRRSGRTRRGGAAGGRARRAGAAGGCGRWGSGRCDGGEVVERYGRIDILAANAGVYHPPVSLDGRLGLGTDHGHQRQGRGALPPGVPSGDARGGLRARRPDVVDHRAARGGALALPLRSLEVGAARADAQRRARARGRRHHVNAVMPGNVRTPGSRRSARSSFRASSTRSRSSGWPSRPTSAGQCASWRPRRRATSRVRHS